MDKYISKINRFEHVPIFKQSHYLRHKYSFAYVHYFFLFWLTKVLKYLQSRKLKV